MARLKWELEWQTRGYEVLAKAARSAPLPEWFLREPIPRESTRSYLTAFWELSTERQVGQVLGPIPESRVREHGIRVGLQGGSMELFRSVIRALDGAYLEHATRRRKAAEGKGSD